MHLRTIKAFAYYLDPFRFRRHHEYERQGYWMVFLLTMTIQIWFFHGSFAFAVFNTLLLTWMTIWSTSEQFLKRNFSVTNRRKKEFIRVTEILLPSSLAETTYRMAPNRSTLTWEERKRLQEQLALFRRHYPEFFTDTPLTLIGD